MDSERPYVIGVTGNIACGKSLVLGALRDLGAETIDADLVAHEIMRRGTPAWRRIVARFGREILGPDDEIDRPRLGAIVFADPAALAALEAIVHPGTVAEIQRRIAHATSRVVAVDAVKLFEAGLDAACDRVWAVVCEPDRQLERLMRRNGLSRDEALTRIKAQPPQEEKARRADLVIDNSGTREATTRQVREAWSSLPVARFSGRRDPE